MPKAPAACPRAYVDRVAAPGIGPPPSFNDIWADVASGSWPGRRGDALGTRHGERLDLAGRSIRVVEDEALVQLHLTGRLQDAGATVFSASRLDKALDFAGHPYLSAGVLDFDLGNAGGTAVCCKLVDRSIPFLFHTGRKYSAFPTVAVRARHPKAGHVWPDLRSLGLFR